MSPIAEAGLYTRTKARSVRDRTNSAGPGGFHPPDSASGFPVFASAPTIDPRRYLICIRRLLANVLATARGARHDPAGFNAGGLTPLTAFEEKTMSLGTILLIVLILLLVGALPTWPHSQSWGYYPSGGLGLVVIVLLILLLLGRI